MVSYFRTLCVSVSLCGSVVDILFDRDTKVEHHSSSLVLRNGIKWLNFINPHKDG